MDRSTYLFRLALAASAMVFATPAFATTKGLNQIVTPDIQPAGQLSLSVQQQDPNIGNRDEAQAELGLTKNFEVAVFQGTSPAEQIGGAELGLLNKGPYLLSTGFVNWSSKGSAPQPFLEAGYYKKSLELIGGLIRVVTEGPGVGGSVRNFHQTQGIAGVAYRVGSHTQLQVDYQSGSGNFSTAGFTYAISGNLSVNPSLYLSNATPRKGYGYVVLSWNIPVFGSSTPPAQPTQKPVNQPTPPASGASR